MRAWVVGAGLRAPGLPGWAESLPVLTGARAWTPAEIQVPPPSLLAANERRRAGLPVRLALAVAEEAVRMSGVPADSLRGVFASGNGEGAILHEVLSALAEDTAISPTRFHNSVHNAVAGYWTMGAQSRQPMTCLGANRDTLAAALLKAMAEASVEREPVLCCVYDVPFPEPIHSKQPMHAAFAAALVLLPEPVPDAMAWIEAAYLCRAPAAAPQEPDNPLAAVLPLLTAIARRQPARAEFGLLDGTVAVDVT